MNVRDLFWSFSLIFGICGAAIAMMWVAMVLLAPPARTADPCHMPDHRCSIHQKFY